MRSQIINARKLLDNPSGMYIPFKARVPQSTIALLQYALDIGMASIRWNNEDGTDLVLTKPFNAFLFAGELGNFEVEAVR